MKICKTGDLILLALVASMDALAQELSWPGVALPTEQSTAVLPDWVYRAAGFAVLFLICGIGFWIGVPKKSSKRTGNSGRSYWIGACGSGYSGGGGFGGGGSGGFGGGRSGGGGSSGGW